MLKLSSLITMIALAASACVTPKTIIDSTRRGKQIKFLYYQPSLSGLKTGVVSCKVNNADGELSGCQNVAIKFKD